LSLIRHVLVHLRWYFLFVGVIHSPQCLCVTHTSGIIDKSANIRFDQTCVLTFFGKLMQLQCLSLSVHNFSCRHDSAHSFVTTAIFVFKG